MITMPAPMLPISVNDERLGYTQSVTLSAGNTYELPFYTFSLTTLAEMRIRFESPVGPPTVAWAIKPINEDGSPDIPIASGSISPTANGWYTLFAGQNYSVSANNFYYLELSVTAGTSVKISGDRYARAKSVGTNILRWDGTALSVAANVTHWVLLYTNGSEWFGNCWPADAAESRTKVGASYKLSQPVRLLGVSFHNWTNIALDTNIYVVKLWNIDPSTWLPTTEITSVNVKAWTMFQGGYSGQITAVFDQEHSVQNFAVTAERSDASTWSVRELYNSDWALVDLIASVRGIYWTGNAWAVWNGGRLPIHHLWLAEGQVGGGAGMLPQHHIIS